MSDYDDLVLARPSLKHFWKLNEASGPTVNDSKGVLNGTIVGGVTPGAASFFPVDGENVMAFDGSTGYITFPSNWGTDANWTYECICRQIANTSPQGDGYTDNCLMQNGTVGSALIGDSVCHQLTIKNNSNKTEFAIAVAGGSGGHSHVGTNTQAVDTPYHFAMTFDGTHLRVYVNGALDSIFADSIPNVKDDVFSSAPWGLIGASKNWGLPNGFFQGSIAKVAYYNTALGSDVILAGYTAATVAPPSPATPETPYYDVRMYGPDNLRRALSKGGCDADIVHAVNFEYLERGGYGQGAVEMLGTWENLQLAGDEHFDIYLLNELAYRGYVRVRENLIESPERCHVTTYGLMEIANQWQVRRKYAYGCPTDLSTVFADMVSDFVDITGRQSGIVVDAEDTGVLVNTFDARGKGFSAAMNDLCDIAPGQVIWGFDTNTSGSNRVYLRNKVETVAYRYVIGKDVEGFVYPRDHSAIVNRLFITGAKADQPNLAVNGDFSDVAPSSETVNNRCLNYSFEDNPNTFWTLNAGATIKDPSVGATAHGAARTGDHWLELDQTGENAVSAAIKIDYTKVQVASLWTRWEDAVASSGDIVTLSVQGYDVSNNPVVLAVVTSPSLNPAGDIYKNFTLTVDFTAYATVDNVKITIAGSGGSASNDGILVDDVGLWEHCSIGQAGWRFSLNGAATIEELDWAVKSSPSPFSGGYCLKLNAAGIAISSDALTVYSQKSARVSAKPNERYTILLRWQTRGLGLGVISFGAVPIKSDGSQDTSQESAQISANPSAWTLQSFPIETASDTSELEIFFRSRSNATIYVSAVMVVEGADPPGVTDDDDYWSGENYEVTLDVEDAELTGLLETLDCDAEDSITDNGEHELPITNENVYNRDTGLALAKDYFKAHGCAKVQASLTVRGPTALMRQAGTVKLLNLPDPPPALFPSRIQYKVSGSEGVIMTAELGNDLPEFATLLALPARLA